MIIVSVKSKIKPEFKEQFMSYIKNIFPLVRAEKGCILYEQNQSIEDENELLLFEKWDTKEDLIAHLKTPHMKKYFEDVKPEWFENLKLEAYESNAIDLSI